jgi:hypothetical protein
MPAFLARPHVRRDNIGRRKEKVKAEYGNEYGERPECRFGCLFFKLFSDF